MNKSNRFNEIFLVFKTHLDIGFTDMGRVIVQKYFEEYIPQATMVAKELRESGKSERFIWTSGAWLIYEYLEQADSRQRRELETAIEHGDIAWHAMPFTVHSELMDSSLFTYGLSLSQKLDRRFGKKTIAAKMTDVPGHTKAIVPILAEAGIKYLHIGVNAASKPTEVPDIFIWEHDDHSQIIVNYSSGGYGNMTIHPQTGCALAFAHTLDNCGPQNYEEVISVFENLRNKYPGRKIVAARLDDFAGKLWDCRANLPVVTHEIGDTWIHGIGSDPAKVSQFLELSRLRVKWLKSENSHLFAKELEGVSRKLLLVPEHTWGLDEKTFLNDAATKEKAIARCLPGQLNHKIKPSDFFDKDSLKKLRKTDKCLYFEESWDEQRRYIDEAIECLSGTPLAQEAKYHLKKLIPYRKPIDDFTEYTLQSAPLETRHFLVGFDPVNGMVNYLRRKESGQIWASASHPLCRFCYELFCQDDYARFARQYVINSEDGSPPWWAVEDFTKKGIGAFSRGRRVWHSILRNMYYRKNKAGICVLINAEMPEESSSIYGAPSDIQLELFFPDEHPAIEIDFQWFKKDACRLPEALWFSFAPVFLLTDKWQLVKMGQNISPHEVVKNGNKKLHAIERLEYLDNANPLTIKTFDAPLVAPGRPSLLDFNNRQPALHSGFHFNLYNNVWATNFRMWYDEDALFRFHLDFSNNKGG